MLIILINMPEVVLEKKYLIKISKRNKSYFWSTFISKFSLFGLQWCSQKCVKNVIYLLDAIPYSASVDSELLLYILLFIYCLYSVLFMLTFTSILLTFELLEFHQNIHDTKSLKTNSHEFGKFSNPNNCVSYMLLMTKTEIF